MARSDEGARGTRERASAEDVLRPVLLIAVGIIPILFLGSMGFSWASTALSVCAAYSGVRLIAVALGGRSQILQLFFWLFGLVFLSLAPMVQFLRDDWPWPGSFTDGLVARTAGIVLVSFLCYDLGRLLVIRRDSAPVRPPRRVLSATRLKIVTVLAVAASVAQMLRLGGPSVLLTDRLQRAALVSDTTTAGLGSAALVGGIFTATYLVVAARRVGVLRGGRVVTWLLVGLTLFVSNPLSTARYRVASVWAGLVLARFWPLTRRQLVLLTTAILAGLAIVFPALNAFRRAGNAADVDLNPMTALLHGDFDAFQQILNTLVFVESRGHTDGNQLLSSVLFFVPRSLWEGKAQDTGVVVAQHQGYVYTNLSAPLQAEAYIDGGWIAVILLFVGLGIITGWFERRAALPELASSFIGLLVPAIAAYQVILLRGSLLQAMGGLATTVAVIWVCTRPAPGSASRTLGQGSSP